MSQNTSKLPSHLKSSTAEDHADTTDESSDSAKDNAPTAIDAELAASVTELWRVTRSASFSDLGRTTKKNHDSPVTPTTAITTATSGELLNHTAEYNTPEGDRIYWGHVLELGLDRKTAVVTLWTMGSDRLDVSCSTEGCDGFDRLEAGLFVQIRLVMSGEQEGQTFVQTTAQRCSPVGSPR